MNDVGYDRGHHAGATPEARIRNRLRNSGGDHAPSGGSVQTGQGPNRTITNLHPYGSRNGDGPYGKGGHE